MFTIIVTVDNRRMRKSATELEELLEAIPDETSFHNQLDNIARIAASEEWKPSACCFPKKLELVRTSLDCLAGQDLYHHGTQVLQEDRERQQITRDHVEP